MALAGTAAVCVVLFVAFMIRDGLSSIKQHNEERREALDMIETYRIAEAEHAASAMPDVEVPDEALDLDVYLQRLADQTNVDIPGFSSQRPETEGAFRRISTSIELDGVSIYDLVEFLERVETEEELVVIWEMDISQNFRDNEMLDVEMTVSTFERAPPDDGGEDEE